MQQIPPPSSSSLLVVYDSPMKCLRNTKEKEGVTFLSITIQVEIFTRYSTYFTLKGTIYQMRKQIKPLDFKENSSCCFILFAEFGPPRTLNTALEKVRLGFLRISPDQEVGV